MEQLRGVVLVHCPVRQHADLPLVRLPRKRRFKPKSPASQSVRLRIAQEKERVVKGDFSVCPHVHPDPEGHLFRPVFDMYAIETEYGFQRSGGFHRPLPDFRLQAAYFRPAFLAFLPDMGEQQHGVRCPENLPAFLPALRGKQAAGLRHGQSHSRSGDGPAVRFFCHRKTLRHIRRARHELTTFAK